MLFKLVFATKVKGSTTSISMDKITDRYFVTVFAKNKKILLTVFTGPYISYVIMSRCTHTASV